MNLPNFLTILRLLFPLFVVIIFYIPLNNYLEKLIILIIFLILSLTDFLDGYLARKLNLLTNFGKIFDPVSDKVLTSAALVYILTFNSNILIPTLLIITREFVVSGNREYMTYNSGKNLNVLKLSKFKTAFQFLSITLFLANEIMINFINLLNIANFCLWITCILTIYTGIQYSYNVYLASNKRK